MASPIRAPIRKPRSATRAAAMLEAVAEVFRERGFAGATIDEIARRARASKTTLYRLFGDKDAMFQQAWAHRFGKSVPSAPLDPAGDPQVVLAALALSILQAVTDPQAAALGRIAIGEAVRNPDLQAVMARGLRYDALAGYLSQCRARGLMAFEDPDATASMFVAMAQSDWTVRTLYGLLDDVSPDALRAHADLAARWFLAGVAPANAVSET